MKALLFLLALFALQMCTQINQPENTKVMQNTTGNPYYSRTDRTKLTISNAEWKNILSPDLYAIAREADTERPFTGKYNEFDELGDYYCAVCGNHLFRSDSKFSSTCGWPRFFEAEKEGVAYNRDSTPGVDSIAVVWRRCASRLGRVSDGAPPPPGMRDWRTAARAGVARHRRK